MKKDSLPDEVLSAHDGDRDGVAEGLEFDLSVLLEQLLAQEDIEAGISLVGNVDDLGVFSNNFLGGVLGTLHFVVDEKVAQFQITVNNAVLMQVLQCVDNLQNVALDL